VTGSEAWAALLSTDLPSAGPATNEDSRDQRLYLLGCEYPRKVRVSGSVCGLGCQVFVGPVFGPQIGRWGSSDLAEFKFIFNSI
jgi:hypothetical protein